jgi:hypothetical protein
MSMIMVLASFRLTEHGYFKVLSGVLQQAKKHIEIMQIKHNNISY